MLQLSLAGDKLNLRNLLQPPLVESAGALPRNRAFLDAVDLGGPAAESLLHTEVMREHLLVAPAAGGWTLSGLFDFEPAMIGAREYEFASVGIYLSGGEGAVLRELLTAYGYAAAELDEALQQCLLVYALLHRYSHLGRYLQLVPPPAGTTTLAALARHWWGYRA